MLRSHACHVGRPEQSSQFNQSHARAPIVQERIGGCQRSLALAPGSGSCCVNVHVIRCRYYIQYVHDMTYRIDPWARDVYSYSCGSPLKEGGGYVLRPYAVHAVRCDTTRDSASNQWRPQRTERRHASAVDAGDITSSSWHRSTDLMLMLVLMVLMVPFNARTMDGTV